MKQLEVLLPGAFDHGFDYVVPETMTLAPGDIVSVPFGRGQSLGVVWGEGKAKIASEKIKPIKIHHSEFPPLSIAMREFIAWAAWYNCAPLGAVLKMVLPVADIAKTGRTTIETAIDTDHLHLAKLSDAQRKAASALEEPIGKGFSVTLLDGVTGSGKTEVYFDAVACALQRTEMKNWRNEELKKKDAPIPQFLNSSIPQFPPSQILVLLPEIALSVQWLERFEKRFGFAPVVWNSQVTPAQKRAGWQAITKGDARVVVGARSALFLPYRNLSLIVVDEEHDGSYKQEEGTIYHARDMAVARGRFEKLPVVLVSATPSLESYHNVKTGKYKEVSLPARHNHAVLPEVEMLDMRSAPTERGKFISDKLRAALAQTIASNHQAMLFLNRRGYAPLVLCRHCGHRFECAECSSWLVAHKGKPRLECHHCGYTQPVPPACPSCGAADSLHACGPGVERVLEEVHEFLPQARVAVMASDQLSGYQELKDAITGMQEGNIDLLIGTQMIAKGHHFAGLAVVGVVDADLGLGGGDLRAAEKTYQLLHQLSGRAGRESVRGRVYLQSYLPEHPVMQALLSGDREAFLQAELQARENAHMPPFSRLAAVIIEGTKEDAVIRTTKLLAANFTVTPSQPPHTPSQPSPLKGEGLSVTRHLSPVTLLGPAPAPLYRLRGKYRYRLLVKAARSINLPDFVKGWVESVKAPSSVRVKVDIDPVGFL
jgi:primosomal protein N' (replication factor Y)